MRGLGRPNHDAAAALGGVPTAACTTPALGENGVDPGFKSDLTATEGAAWDCECALLRDGSNGGARLESVDGPSAFALAFALAAPGVDDAEDEPDDACGRNARAWWFGWVLCGCAGACGCRWMTPGTVWFAPEGGNAPRAAPIGRCTGSWYPNGREGGGKDGRGWWCWCIWG